MGLRHRTPRLTQSFWLCSTCCALSTSRRRADEARSNRHAISAARTARRDRRSSIELAGRGIQNAPCIIPAPVQPHLTLLSQLACRRVHVH
ncbi:hypothetical protein T492DRAFT_944797 [Pavlovales sp. CCMP2436]|nr:hypothetical protein T492DRAFT_944797 [Pavlovales sp. CCMP2436]